MPPDLALLSTLTGSNYPCLELIFMVPKVFEPLKFDCICLLGPISRCFKTTNELCCITVKVKYSITKRYSMFEGDVKSGLIVQRSYNLDIMPYERRNFNIIRASCRQISLN